MNTEQLKELFMQTFAKCTDTMLKKNHDYSKGNNALRNFELVEYLGIADTPQGVLVRLSDKFMRICNLYNTDAKVKDEAVEDTIDDMINYLVILKATLRGSSEPKAKTNKLNFKAWEKVKVIKKRTKK